MNRDLANAVQNAGRAIGEGLARIGDALKMRAAIHATEHEISVADVKTWLREYRQR